MKQAHALTLRGVFCEDGEGGSLVDDPIHQAWPIGSHVGAAGMVHIELQWRLCGTNSSQEYQSRAKTNKCSLIPKGLLFSLGFFRTLLLSKHTHCSWQTLLAGIYRFFDKKKYDTLKTYQNV